MNTHATLNTTILLENEEVKVMDNQLSVTQIDPEIREYLEDILLDAGMTHLDQRQYEQLILDLFSRLDSALTDQILNKLDAADRNKFSKMIEEKRPQTEKEAFLQEKLRDPETFMTQALIKFRSDYLGEDSDWKGV